MNTVYHIELHYKYLHEGQKKFAENFCQLAKGENRFAGSFCQLAKGENRFAGSFCQLTKGENRFAGSFCQLTKRQNKCLKFFAAALCMMQKHPENLVHAFVILQTLEIFLRQLSA